MTLPYLSMMRGDTTQFSYTVTNDGEPIDLVNAELIWTARPLPWTTDDDSGDIVKTLDDGITVVDEEEGTIVIQMDAVDTEDLTFSWSSRRHSYTWDLQVVDDYEQTMTRGRGILYVHRDITVEVVP